MTARMPYASWPRGLNADLAAAYVGVSRTKFLEEVDTGIWPKGERRGGRVIWDRVKLDKAWDRLEESGDPFMEALHDSRKA